MFIFSCPSSSLVKSDSSCSRLLRILKIRKTITIGFSQTENIYTKRECVLRENQDLIKELPCELKFCIFYLDFSESLNLCFVFMKANCIFYVHHLKITSEIVRRVSWSSSAWRCMLFGRRGENITNHRLT